MTPEEARTELMKRDSGSVCAGVSCWRFSRKDVPIVNHYRLSYNFGDSSCSSVEGSSFEDCFAQMDEQDRAVNAEIKKYSILLRKFD